MRRPPGRSTPPQIELPVTLVALAAATAALVQALVALLVQVRNLQPPWARSAAAVTLAVAGLLSLGLARLRTGRGSRRLVSGCRWATLAFAVAAVVIALVAAVR